MAVHEALTASPMRLTALLMLPPLLPNEKEAVGEEESDVAVDSRAPSNQTVVISTPSSALREDATAMALPSPPPMP